MKRYWLFVYSQYYPNGGMEDFFADFDSVDEARDCYKDFKSRRTIGNEYMHVFDSESRKVVYDNLREWEKKEQGDYYEGPSMESYFELWQIKKVTSFHQ